MKKRKLYLALSLVDEIETTIEPMGFKGQQKIDFEPGLVGAMFVYANEQDAVSNSPAGTKVVLIETE